MDPKHEDFLAMLARFTPEQRRIFEGQMADRLEAQLLGQPWVGPWLAKPHFLWIDEAKAWVRSRPPSVQALMLRFPPNCHVKAKPEHSLMVPAPGTFGIVASYSEDGSVSVVQSPTAGIRAQCRSEWLELAACRLGQDIEDVRAVLEAS